MGQKIIHQVQPPLERTKKEEGGHPRKKGITTGQFLW